MHPMDWLAGYGEELQAQAEQLRVTGELRERLAKRYPSGHGITDNGRLRDYVMEIKRDYLGQSAPLHKVGYSDKIATLYRALGTHTYAVRIQGSRLKRKNELRVASLFKELPGEFLRMVVVHELAHLRHRDHDKAFYRLCEHMEPDYHQYEMDLRLWLFDREKR
ncbi:MAG: M48 family metallopeptidase [Alphaproteobacteria bacterium]|nr:M48 family metallopeptidase [Alphaproteobacteria bacterium]